MSIRLQIIIPLVLAILAGIGVSFLIARQSNEGQRAVAATVEQALDARARTAKVAVEIEEMRADMGEILKLTTFVPRAEVERRFSGHDNAIGEVLAGFSQNTLSGGIGDQVAGLQPAYGSWRDSLKLALGLTPTTAVPTTEKLNREQQALMERLTAVEDIVGEAAQSMIAAANETLASETDRELTMLAIGGGVALIISLLIVRGITRPLLHVTRAMRELADGVEDVQLPGKSFTPEIRRMTAALEVFRDNAVERARLEAESETAQAERRRYADEMAQLIAQMSSMMDGAVRGDFSGRVDSQFTVADLNVLANNANTLVETVDRNVEAVLQVMTALADGDLGRRMDGQASGAFAELQMSINTTFEKLVPLIRSIKSAAETVSQVSTELEGSASDLSDRTVHQAASLEETAATLEEITQTVKQSEQRAAEAMARVAEARANSEKSGVVVQDAVEAMGRVEQASGKIGSITEMIDEIACQTNLLALNAGVEASRAGSAGAGFAVVAQEVRALAQRAAQAARDIKALIRTTSDEVASGVTLVNAAGKSLRSIQEQIAEVDQHIRSISTGAKEQSEGIHGINEAVGKIDRLTQDNAAMVQQTAEAVGAMSQEASSLLATIAHFRVEEDRANYYRPRRTGLAA